MPNREDTPLGRSCSWVDTVPLIDHHFKGGGIKVDQVKTCFYSTCLFGVFPGLIHGRNRLLEKKPKMAQAVRLHICYRDKYYKSDFAVVKEVQGRHHLAPQIMHQNLAINCITVKAVL